MPKIKSHSGSKKRFKVSGSGKLLFKHTNKRHLLRKRSKRRKRALSITAIIRNCDYPRLKRILHLRRKQFGGSLQKKQKNSAPALD